MVPGFRDLEGESLKNPLTAESYVSLEVLPPVPPLGGRTLKILSGRGDTGKMERWKLDRSSHLEKKVS